jgi:ERCC4-type nuclease
MAKEIFNTKIKIICDTREQKPLFVDANDLELGRSFIPSEFWTSKVELSRDKLDAGDYSLVAHDLPGDDYSVIFERKKDCTELASNLVTNWDRFLAEMSLLKNYKHKQIIVCKPENFHWLHEQGYIQFSPNLVYKRLALLHWEFGISTTFLGSRLAAENYIYYYMRDIMNKALNDG